MVLSKRSLLAMMNSWTSSATSGAGAPVFGCLYLWNFSILFEKTFSVFLCRLLIEMRAASLEKSGCCVLM